MSRGFISFPLKLRIFHHSWWIYSINRLLHINQLVINSTSHNLKIKTDSCMQPNNVNTWRVKLVCSRKSDAFGSKEAVPGLKLTHWSKINPTHMSWLMTLCIPCQIFVGFPLNFSGQKQGYREIEGMQWSLPLLHSVNWEQYYDVSRPV